MCQGRRRHQVKVVPIKHFIETASTTPKHDHVDRTVTPPSSYDEPTNRPISIVGCNERKKKVRFVEDGRKNDHAQVNVTIIDSSFKPSSKMTTEEKKERWWQEDETLFFCQAAHAVSIEIQKRQKTIDNTNEDSYTSVLSRAFAESCRFAHDEEDVNEDDFFFLKDNKDARLLERWAKIGHCRRGLERWSCPVMANERTKRKRITVQGVLHVQKLLSTRDDIRQDQMAEALRATSEKCSRPSKLFALAMGEADSIVAKESTSSPLHHHTVIQADFENPKHVFDDENITVPVCVTPTHSRDADTHHFDFKNPKHVFVTATTPSKHHCHQQASTPMVLAPCGSGSTPTHDRRGADAHFVF